MYKIKFLPIAKNDIDEIIYYISNNLKNIPAAQSLSNLFIKSAKDIAKFPYGVSIYKTVKKLNYEYRCFKINNFLMFYIINEQENIITIVRVLYNKMNIDNLLNN